MNAQLLLGIATMLIGLGTFVAQAVLRHDGRITGRGVHLLSGPFATLTFGVVPLLAAMAFLGAWWMDDGGERAEVAVQRPVGRG